MPPPRCTGEWRPNATASASKLDQNNWTPGDPAKSGNANPLFWVLDFDTEGVYGVLVQLLEVAKNFPKACVFLGLPGIERNDKITTIPQGLRKFVIQ